MTTLFSDQMKVDCALRMAGLFRQCTSSAPRVHPSIHGQTPLKKDTYPLGKNDVLLRTVPAQKNCYTSYEATHETSSDPCRHDTSSTGTLRRTPCRSHNIFS